MCPATTAKTCVIVGASLGGLRAAESLRRSGFTGKILVFGAEQHMPYNRPPLSKEALSDQLLLDSLTYRLSSVARDVEWQLGQRVVSSDLKERSVTTEGGARTSWDGLVIATGVTPRRLPIPGPTQGRHVVRTIDDVFNLRRQTYPGARVVIIGAGFIGCEVASTCRTLGADVHVIGPESVPMERPLGRLLGGELQRRHEERGVRFHMDTVPISFTGPGRVERVQLSDGNELVGDVVIESVGTLPDVLWLEGNELDLTDGVLCDNQMRVQGRADVVACGDVARFPNPLFDSVPRRVEHWTMVGDTARKAGKSLASHLLGAVPGTSDFRPLPSFWSDQYNLRIQSFGAITLGSEDVRVIEGDLGGDVIVGYHRDGELVGVVMLGSAARHAHYRSLLATLDQPRQFREDRTRRA